MHRPAMPSTPAMTRGVQGPALSILDPALSVAVVGAGIAGAACAASLQQAGLIVTLFDKSRGVGGRLATRRAQWTGADGVEHSVEFDHGAQTIAARQPRFRALLARAEGAGVVTRWRLARARRVAGAGRARRLGGQARHAGAGAVRGARRAAAAGADRAATAPHGRRAGNWCWPTARWPALTTRSCWRCRRPRPPCCWPATTIAGPTPWPPFACSPAGR